MATEGNYCKQCGKELNPVQRPCPYCGGEGIDFKRILTTTVEVRSSMAYKQKRKGYKRPLREGKSGWSPSKDVAKHPDGVEKEQSFDRENDEYREKITDKRTGKVVRDVSEPLSKHRGKPKK